MTDLNLRTAVESDAEKFLDLLDALDTETEFMLYEPNERKATLYSQKSRLANAVDSEFVRIYVLEDISKDLIAGFCAGRRSSNFRDKHSLHIVVGLRLSYTGLHWGQKLLEKLEEWAKSVNICRLELSVMVNNSRAVSLYKKLGYEIEGTKISSVYLRTGFVDEHIMAKLI